MRDIDLNDYVYDLPSDRIAQYPVNERDMSKLLVFRNNNITSTIFKKIDDFIPADSLLVFNNTSVIRARIPFLKDTGASIEVFCLEPVAPAEYELSFGSGVPVVWNCIIGNLKKWKGQKISKHFLYNKKEYELTAEKIRAVDDAWEIRLSWNCPDITFGEMIDITGHIPLPPYISREDNEEDINRYQTVYASVKGSVAAPTAGLHFTDQVFQKLRNKGIKSTEVTLHVGAGTFQPIKTKRIFNHEMHCEHFLVTKKTIESLLENRGRIIAVGTTSVRTLESLFWIGTKLILKPSENKNVFTLGQWEAYDINCICSVQDSLRTLLNYMINNDISHLNASTKIMIIPGYDFKMVDGIITNFHQPGSTLLLLVSALIGDTWKYIYSFALENRFRFLSYGDCSLIFR